MQYNIILHKHPKKGLFITSDTIPVFTQNKLKIALYTSYYLKITIGMCHEINLGRK